MSRVTISKFKAIRIEGVEIKGKNYVSLRQLYCTEKAPEWKPARQGITIPVDDDVAAKIARAIMKISKGDEFKAIEVGGKDE